jgi:capsular polysaccharide biosynthesis protein
MEIGQYLRTIKKKLLLLPAVALIAAVAAYFVLGHTKQQWTSTVRVEVPTSAQNTAAGAVTVYVANFSQFLKSDPVVAQVAAQNPGIKAKSIKSGLSASEVGVSDLIDVTFTGRPKDAVSHVAQSAATAALSASADPQVVDAQAALKIAEQRDTAAQTALQNFVNTESGGLPDDQYRERLANLDAIKLAASQARLDLDIPKANGLDAQIPQAEAQIAALLPQVEKYDQLTNGASEADSAVSVAYQHVQDAQAQADAAASLPALKSDAPKKVNERLKKGEYMGIAAGLGLIAAALYIVMSELIGARRVRRSTVDLGTQLDSVEMPLTPATNGNGNGNGNGHSPHPASAPHGRSEPAG